MFGRRVGRLHRHRLDPGDGADDHDRAPVARFEHRRDGRLERLPGSVHVDIDDVHELALGHLVDAAPGEHTGIDDDVVESAELGDAVGHELLLARQVTGIELAGKNIAARGLDLAHGLFHVFGGGHRITDLGDLTTYVEPDDRCAFLGESDRVTAALPAGDARDVDDLAVEISHIGHCLRRSERGLSTTSRYSKL